MYIENSSEILVHICQNTRC